MECEGGVSAAGEASGITLLRELQEEVGLDFHTSLPPAGYDNESQRTDQDSMDNMDVLQQKGRNTKHTAATILKNYQQSKPSGNQLKYLGISYSIPTPTTKRIFA